MRRSTTISLVVAALSLWTVWRFTWKKESVRLLDGYDFRYFTAAAGLLVLSWLADGLRVTLTARAAGYPLAFFHGVRSILAGHFMAAITPFLAGGAPLQVYSLYRGGVPSGAATALVFASGLMAQLMLVVASLGLTLWPSSPFAGDGGMLLGVRLFRILVLAYAVGLTAFFLLIWYSEAGGRRLILAAAGFLRNRGWGDPGRLEQQTEGLLAFFKELNAAFRQLVTGRPLAALASLGGYSLYFALYFSIAPVLLGGLGASVSFFDAVALQIPLYLIASILPTPGASGGFEAGMAVLFSDRVPEAGLGLFVVGWRILTYYGHIIAGGLATFLLLKGAWRLEAGKAKIEPPGQSRAPMDA